MTEIKKLKERKKLRSIYVIWDTRKKMFVSNWGKWTYDMNEALVITEKAAYKYLKVMYGNRRRYALYAARIVFERDLIDLGVDLEYSPSPEEIITEMEDIPKKDPYKVSDEEYINDVE